MIEPIKRTAQLFGNHSFFYLNRRKNQPAGRGDTYIHVLLQAAIAWIACQTAHMCSYSINNMCNLIFLYFFDVYCSLSMSCVCTCSVLHPFLKLSYIVYCNFPLNLLLIFFYALLSPGRRTALKIIMTMTRRIIMKQHICFLFFFCDLFAESRLVIPLLT